MLEWFESIGNFLISIGDFIVSFFKNVIEMVLLVFKAFAYTSAAIAFLPVQYQVAISVLIAFSLIVTILHFGG